MPHSFRGHAGPPSPQGSDGGQQTADVAQLRVDDIRRALLDRLRDAPGLSLTELLAAAQAYLADIESLGWVPRFQRILDEARPSLPGVDGDRLALDKRHQAQPWRAAARRFIAPRRRSLACLKTYDDSALRRPVVFAGARTRAGGVLAAAVAHDLDHRPARAERWAAHVKSSRNTA